MFRDQKSACTSSFLSEHKCTCTQLPIIPKITLCLAIISSLVQKYASDNERANIKGTAYAMRKDVGISGFFMDLLLL